MAREGSRSHTWDAGIHGLRGVYRKRLLRPGLTGLVQAHKDELSAMGGDRVLDEAYIEACRTLSPVRLLVFDLRVVADTFRILARGEGL